jgi:uncharacterized protein
MPDRTPPYHGVALITGASSGIGAATALRLARAGVPVALTARRADRLEEVCARIKAEGGQAYAVAADLREPGERERVVAAIDSACGPIGVLVNNAGIGWYGFVADMPHPEMADIIAVNLSATVHLTALVLPGMLSRRHGAIINIGSIASNFAAPGNVIYGSTKSFVHMFTTGLYRELRGTDVRVSVVHAGPVKTGFFAATARRSGRHVPGERFGVPPDRVAEAVAAVLRRPRRQIYVPRWMRATTTVETCAGWLLNRIPARLIGSPATHEWSSP